ncbi:YdcF family protein [Marinitenerispora sediminis]|uniref:YdcF family protein n=1 Tax=Marinitenerispora sediminis TaxID=1931232 RepID=UPI001F23BF55|nr:YdcF family protein [Marinitenerispora sediminis]
MPAADEERGNEPREESPLGAAPDLEATRTFAREPRSSGAPGDAAVIDVVGVEADGPAERTRVFTRAADGPAAPVPPDRAPPGPDPTRTMTRPRLDPDRAEPGPDPPPRRRRPRPAAGPDRPARRWGRRIAWTLALLAVTAVLVPCLTWAWVWYVARQDERPPSDAIVVLGASQYNGRPSPIFEARLRHAADLYEQGVAPAVVTVGGNQPGDAYTEGGSGRDWLVNAGVPAEDVVAIGEGSDTLQSIEAVSRVYQQLGWTSAVIVTDPWHSLRSRTMAEDFGIEAATSPARSGPAVLERETQLWYITRETASVWYYWIFGDSSTLHVDAA